MRWALFLLIHSYQILLCYIIWQKGCNLLHKLLYCTGTAACIFMQTIIIQFPNSLQCNPVPNIPTMKLSTLGTHAYICYAFIWMWHSISEVCNRFAWGVNKQAGRAVAVWLGVIAASVMESTEAVVVTVTCLLTHLWVTLNLRKYFLKYHFNSSIIIITTGIGILLLAFLLLGCLANVQFTSYKSIRVSLLIQAACSFVWFPLIPQYGQSWDYAGKVCIHSLHTQSMDSQLHRAILGFFKIVRKDLWYWIARVKCQ